MFPWRTTVLLGISIFGNWEQFKELDLRQTKIDELKLEKQGISQATKVAELRLTELREKGAVVEQLELELKEIRESKETAVHEIAGLKAELQKQELNEVQRKELEKELAKANARLDKKDETLMQKDALYSKLSSDYSTTQSRLADLSLQTCGAFTPTGFANMAASSFGVAPGATSILSYIILSFMTSFLWRNAWSWIRFGPPVLGWRHRTPIEDMQPSDGRPQSIQAGKTIECMAPPVQCWFVWCTSKSVALIVLLLAVARLPILLRNFAGDQAMNAMESTRSTACEHLSLWGLCEGAFNYALIPMAIVTAEGETYVHLIRGWNQFALAQALALLAEKGVVLSLHCGAASLALTCGALGLRQRRCLQNGSPSSTQYLAPRDGVPVWKSCEGWETFGMLAEGDVVEAAGVLEIVDGYEMVPIKPAGAVELVSVIEVGAPALKDTEGDCGFEDADDGVPTKLDLSQYLPADEEFAKFGA